MPSWAQEKADTQGAFCIGKAHPVGGIVRILSLATLKDMACDKEKRAIGGAGTDGGAVLPAAGDRRI